MDDYKAYTPQSAEQADLDRQYGAKEPQQDPDDIFSEAAAQEARASVERWKDLPPEPADPELVALREQLFRREIAIINKLKIIMDNGHFSARELSKVLSEAIVLQAGKDERLTTALEPTVEKIVTQSMRLNQDEFVNAMFPLMGPSIRRSISENFRSMMGNFSKSLEMAFSWKGLRWRLEALRTGKSFGDIVLLHTLVYRVEQMFFIHSETGLMLSHLVNEGVGGQDADMVSAMLTAIQDFVRDCFANGQQDVLEALQMGDYTIIIEKGTHAYLACVVRGTPPSDFRERLRNSLDRLHVEYAPQFAAFSGDTTPFRLSVRILEDFMETRYVDETKDVPTLAKAAPVLLLLGLAFGLYFYKWNKAVDVERINAALALVRSEPGIIMVHVEDKGRAPWEIIALKDDMARDPGDFLPEATYPKNWQEARLDFRMVPFISYDPAIIYRRVHESLVMPPGVRMHLGDGVLTLNGKAPLDWIMRTRDIAYSLPGIKRVDVTGVQDPRMAEMLRLIREVESVAVLFPMGQAKPASWEAHKLANAVDTLVLIEKLAAEIGLAASLTIYGHADTTGSEEANYLVSRARTQTVAAMLYARGSGMPIAMYGMGSQYAKGGEGMPDASAEPVADKASRRIEMRVHLLQSVQPITGIVE